jgi:hypothetical protein
MTEEIKQATYIDINTQSTIPKQFRPTKKLATIFIMLILAVIIFGLISFPYSSILTGTTKNIAIKIGYPLIFLELNLDNPNQFPLNLPSFMIDILLYLLIAYAIDIIINLAFNTQKTNTQPTAEPPEDNTGKSNSIADKVTKKILKDTPKKTTQVQYSNQDS